MWEDIFKKTKLEKQTRAGGKGRACGAGTLSPLVAHCGHRSRVHARSWDQGHTVSSSSPDTTQETGSVWSACPSQSASPAQQPASPAQPHPHNLSVGWGSLCKHNWTESWGLGVSGPPRHVTGVTSRAGASEGSAESHRVHRHTGQADKDMQVKRQQRAADCSHGEAENTLTSPPPPCSQVCALSAPWGCR